MLLTDVNQVHELSGAEIAAHCGGKTLSHCVQPASRDLLLARDAHVASGGTLSSASELLASQSRRTLDRLCPVRAAASRPWRDLVADGLAGVELTLVPACGQCPARFVVERAQAFLRAAVDGEHGWQRMRPLYTVTMDRAIELCGVPL